MIRRQLWKSVTTEMYYANQAAIGQYFSYIAYLQIQDRFPLQPFQRSREPRQFMQWVRAGFVE